MAIGACLSIESSCSITPRLPPVAFLPPDGPGQFTTMMASHPTRIVRPGLVARGVCPNRGLVRWATVPIDFGRDAAPHPGIEMRLLPRPGEAEIGPEARHEGRRDQGRRPRPSLRRGRFGRVGHDRPGPERRPRSPHAAEGRSALGRAGRHPQTVDRRRGGLDGRPGEGREGPAGITGRSRPPFVRPYRSRRMRAGPGTPSIGSSWRSWRRRGSGPRPRPTVRPSCGRARSTSLGSRRRPRRSTPS